MKVHTRTALLVSVLGALLAAAGHVPAFGSSERAAMTSREKALHVLNRLAFGPRPGDVEKVLAMGVGNYIESQLKPERIPDTAIAEKLRHLPTLQMTTA